jgi:hypothetical protein
MIGRNVSIYLSLDRSLMDIALDLTEFRQSQSGAVTGPIWVRHETTEFPERGWSDFPVRILRWWFDALASLASGSQAATFSFMDGPFEFRILQTPPSGFRVQLIERGSDAPSVIKEFVIALPKLQNSLHIAAGTVLAECNRRAWVGRDVDALRSSAAAVRH